MNNLRIIPTFLTSGLCAGNCILPLIFTSIVIEIPNKLWEIPHLIQTVLKDHLHWPLQTVRTLTMALIVNQASPNLLVAHRPRHEHQTHLLLLQVQQQ